MKTIHQRIFFFCLPIVLMLIPIKVHAQSFQDEIDSLYQTLEKVSTPEDSIDILNDISYLFRRISPDSMIARANTVIKYAHRINYNKGLATGYKNKGIAFFKQGAIADTTSAYYRKAISYAELAKDYYTLAACYNNLALIDLNNLAYNQALQSLFKGIEIFNLHIEEENQLKALMICNVGTIYHKLEQHEKGVEYYEKGLEMADRLKKLFIRSVFQDELARAKMNLGRLEEAAIDLEEVLPLHDYLEDYESKAETLLTYAELEIERQNYPKAKELAYQAMKVTRERNYATREVFCYLRITQANIGLNMLDSAYVSAEEALKRARKFGNLLIEAQVLTLLSEIAAKQENFQKAYEFSQAYIAVKEQEEDEISEEITAELEAKYNNEEREREIIQLNEEKSRQQNQLYISLLVSLVFIILSIILIYQYLTKQRTSKKLDQKNRALEKVNRELLSAEETLNGKNEELNKYIESNMQLENFAYLASHDLKTPLRTIISFTQLLERRVGNAADQELKEYFSFIQDATKNMNMLIQDLLSYSQVNTSKLTLSVFSPHALVGELIQELQTFILDNNAQVVVGKLPKHIQADRGKLKQILQNLVINGIKFSGKKSQPQVHINIETSKKYWTFSIRDNGIGIAPEYQDKIFLIFQRLHSREKYEGTGMGLSICKKIVEQHGGKIWVESSIGDGSTFYFNISRKLVKKIQINDLDLEEIAAN